LEQRIAAAEERAREAERRLDEAKPRRSRSRASRSAKGDVDGGGEVDTGETALTEVEPADMPPVDDVPEEVTADGSDLRSRLVRSTDARRRGISTPTAVPTPGPKRR
jgi:hypothetical protein